MTHRRKALLAALAAIAALAVTAPAAGASTFATPAFADPGGVGAFQATPGLSAAAVAGTVSSLAGPCATATGQHGQGATAGTVAQVCTGSGLTFIAPAVGQISSIVGPSIITPGPVGTVVVAAGNASVG